MQLHDEPGFAAIIGRHGTSGGHPVVLIKLEGSDQDIA